ncbi:hypothetical protein PITC_020890 [Penicillium italicum]|uniref:Uncharacterized protein n=1 Tax=Penicillium italicum TaxID=40296 RepID=A0A0A2L0Y6_PENIT|nr:hypothetical protein PITC_020890 [Penicillium italicum]
MLDDDVVSQPLLSAVRRNDLDLVELLLDHGADVNMRCSEQYIHAIDSPFNHVLLWAVDGSKEAMVNLLLESDADLEITDLTGQALPRVEARTSKSHFLAILEFVLVRLDITITPQTILPISSGQNRKHFNKIPPSFLEDNSINMAEGGYVNGWEQHASYDQITRSAGSQIGHPDAAALGHLSRALYIPRHDKKATHLAVHDISDQYAVAKGTLPVGSTKYAVAIGVMPKPQGDGPDDITVSYDVDFEVQKDAEAVVGLVKGRAQSSLSDEVELEISTTEEEAAVLTTNGANETEILLNVTYPIAPSSTRNGIVTHPYFNFQVPDSKAGSTTYQWQIHPSRNGRLRYTLVRSPAPQHDQQEPSDADIQAVYYHIGLDDSLYLPHSEGILLLPAGQISAGESIVVSSALGMLWRLRELHRGKGKLAKAGEKKSRLGGTPTPTPMAVSCEELEPLLGETGVDAFPDFEPGDFTDKPATPGIAVPLGMLTDLKLPQSTVPFFKVAVPQQCTVLLPLCWEATIGKPEFLL